MDNLGNYLVVGFVLLLIIYLLFSNRIQDGLVTQDDSYPYWMWSHVTRDDVQLLRAKLLNDHDLSDPVLNKQLLEISRKLLIACSRHIYAQKVVNDKVRSDLAAALAQLKSYQL